LYTDLRTYLPDNLNVKMDIASMSNSLEVWSPFQDYKLIEFAASLPDKWKLKGKTSKYILKDTFNELLPQEIIKRPKQGFGLPLARWFREEESNYIKSILLSGKALSRGYFKAQAIRRIVDDHMAGKADYAYPIWTLLVLELWHREVLD
ncbi:MAG: asparagine synthetase B, partial [Elusimicrobia bacterium]|nr:asparagine synthetase B [Elusimicrobiota bacterium]